MTSPAHIPEEVTEKYNPFEGEAIVAENVSYEDFLRLYDSQHAEWYQGKVILVMANNNKHQIIFSLLDFILRLYFDLKPIGTFRMASFSMRVSEELPHREPDVMIILNEHIDRIKNSYLDGAADVAIEIVSPESVARDHGYKFYEYEMAGVREYWLIDPTRQIADIYVLGADHHYRRTPLDAQGRLVSSLLPQFALDPEIFWREAEPSARELIELVQRMLG